MSRVIAITGASAGIGRATALRLARDRAAIAMCARRREQLEAAAGEVRNAGGEALPFVADVSREPEMHAFVKGAVDTFGHLDVMMCNAGFGVYGSIDTIAPAQMEQVLQVNFVGTYNAIHAAIPLFRQQGHGHIIIVSSIVGKRGVPYMGAYSATKFAQVGLAECLRAEVSGSAIHVTVVYPISTQTEFFEVMTKESGYATRAHGPTQSAEQVADAIAHAIERPVPEVYPYRKARGLTILNALAPGFCDQLVRRWGRKPIA